MNKNIMVNAFISQNNIKIIATGKLNDRIINIHEESISRNSKNNDVENRIKIKNSIKNIIDTIEEKISQKIKSIDIIFDDCMKSSKMFNFSTRIIEEKIECKDKKFLNIEDYELIVKKSKTNSKLNSTDEILISVTPFKFFYIENDELLEKESNLFPFNKKVKKLRMLFTNRYIDKKNYQKTIDLFDKLNNVKIKNVVLESQIAIYDDSFINKDLSKNNQVNYTLSIQKHQTMLITSVNNIVIKTDTLNYCFSDLIEKIAMDFDISNYEAKKLIECYGDLDNNNNNKNIYFSHSIKKDISKCIKQVNISDVIKSFLKSICMQANSIIMNSKLRSDNLQNKKIELNIIGYLSKISNMKQYCLKYFNNEIIKVNMIENDESIYKWNKIYMYSKKLWAYMNVLNHLKSDNFYYSFNYNNNYSRRHLLTEVSSKRNSNVLLA